MPPSIRWVAVHDGVRPLVTPQIVDQTLRAARRYRAAIAAVPSKDTVKLADAKGRIQKSPPRETVWMAQTPQVFERSLLERAHRRNGGEVTDDSQLVERIGVRVHLVESVPENMKVTHPFDLKIAELILRARR